MDVTLLFLSIAIILVEATHVEIKHLRVKRSGGSSSGNQPRKKVKIDADGMQLNDTEWISGKQWYLDKQSSNQFQTLDVRTAWEQCVTGEGISVAVIDNSILHNNIDLNGSYGRYDSAFSYNVNSSANNPTFDVIIGGSDRATLSAGIIAANANEFCGVGVAYDAKVTGVKTAENLSDENYAAVLEKHISSVDIIVDVMDHLSKSPLGAKTQTVLEKAVKQSRGGKGAVIVVAAGDHGVSCARNGIVNRRETIAVTGIKRTGGKLDNGCECTAVMASAYSKNPKDKDSIVTVSGTDTCTEEFSGSAPAASFAAGIMALVLQANRNLSWRDVQHLIVQSSTSTTNVRFNPNNFVKNHGGHFVSPTFGFGLLDAGKMVKLARVWKSVDEAYNCRVNSKTSDILIDGSSCQSAVDIHYVEHVIVHLKIKCDTENLVLHLVSPKGTKSTVFSQKVKEKSIDSSVLSVMFWRENPQGKWELKFENACKGNLDWGLEIHGTLNDSISSQNLTKMDEHSRPCPYKSPSLSAKNDKTDFTPLYIFIVLIIIIGGIGLLIITYRKCWGSKVKKFCGPGFTQVATTEPPSDDPAKLHSSQL